jgi:hypothetical protein
MNAVRKRLFRDAGLRASADPPDALYQLPRQKQLLRPSGSGQFAIVFKLMVQEAETAVRVYESEPHARQSESHYRSVDNYFGRGRPSCLIAFRHYSDEMDVNGLWYPVLTMEWLRGPQLGAWIAERVKAGDSAALRDMADRWVDLIEELRRSGVAHGDLQHGNVLVVDGVPKLIDYDGMWASSFGEQPCLEQGHLAYQHPQRPGQLASLALDDFSAWVILLALRGLASDLGLWQRHVHNEDDEKDRPLLFSTENLRPLSDPSHSGQLWEDLLRSSDPEVQGWARELRAALDQPFEKIPPFEIDRRPPVTATRQTTLLEELRRLPWNCGEESDRRWSEAWDDDLLRDCPEADPLRPRWQEARSRLVIIEELRRRRAAGQHDRLDALTALLPVDYEYVAHWPAATDPHRRPTDFLPGSGGAVQPLVSAPPDEHQALIDELHAAMQAGEERGIDHAATALLAAGGRLPMDLAARVELASRRVACLDVFEPLARRFPREQVDRDLCASWDESLLADCHEADPFRRRYQEAGRRVAMLDTLRALLVRYRAGTVSEETVLAAEAVRLPADYQYDDRAEVQVLRNACEALAALQAALAVVPPHEAGIARAWDQLKRAGGHRAAALYSVRAELAQRRAPALERVKNLAPLPPTEENDRRLRQAWDEGGLDDCPEAEPLRTRAESARDRLRTVDALGPIIAGDQEELIAQTGAALADYPHRFQERVRQAGDRVKAFRELVEGFESGGNVSVIARAWARLEAAGGHPDSGRYREAAKLAQRRVQALVALRTLTGARPNEAGDQAIVRTWEKADLDHHAPADSYRQPYLAAHTRLQILEEVRRLLGSAAPEQVAAAAAPLPDDYPHALVDRVKTAREQARAIAEIEAALRTAPSLDVALADAWDACCAAGVPPTDPAVQKHCRRALRVRDCLRQLRGIDPALAADEMDRLWLEYWDESLLADSADAISLQAKDRVIRERVRLWQELEQAIAAADVLAVARLAKNGRLKSYPPLERVRATIQPLIERGEKAEVLLHLLQSDNNAAIRAALDLTCVAGLPDMFRPHRRRLLAVIETALAANPLRPGDPPWQLDAGRRELRLWWTGWNWPEFGLPGRRCRIAVHRERFLGSPDEDPEGTLHPWQNSCGSGYPVPVPEGATRIFVTIWPVIALDPQVFDVKEAIGAALRLGPIAVKRKWWSLLTED